MIDHHRLDDVSIRERPKEPFPSVIQDANQYVGDHLLQSPYVIDPDHQDASPYVVDHLPPSPYVVNPDHQVASPYVVDHLPQSQYVIDPDHVDGVCIRERAGG